MHGQVNKIGNVYQRNTIFASLGCLAKSDISSKKLLLFIAYFAVFILWGAYYIGSQFALETIPPILTGGVRFFIAGCILFIIARWVGERMPNPGDLHAAIKQSIWLFVASQCFLVWGMQYIPSGLTSVIMATTPLWVVALDIKNWKYSFRRPLVILGMFLGVLGVYLITVDKKHPINLTQNPHFYEGFIAIILSTVSWAYGSLYTQKELNKTPLILNLSLQMILGGGDYIGNCRTDRRTQRLFICSSIFKLCIRFSLHHLYRSRHLLFGLFFSSTEASCCRIKHLWLCPPYSCYLFGRSYG